MKTLLATLCVLIIAGVALAEKPVIESNGWQPTRIGCPFQVTVYEWDFAVGDQGFTPAECDPNGGEPVWQYGAEGNFSANVWATVLNGEYPSNAGEALVSPTFVVDTSISQHMVQLTHYFDIETNYDGCNLMVNGTVVAPMEMYTVEELSPSTFYNPYCVDLQPGFTGHDLEPWVMVQSCFDLSDFNGQEVNLEFQFGSDSSVTYPGWYLGSVIVGGDDPIGTRDTRWDAMKALYR